MKNKILFIIAIVGLGFLVNSISNSTLVSAATCSWNGGTDTNWSTASNWSSCGGTIPGNGDNITFPNGAANITNTNDLGAFSFANVTFDDDYTVSGNAINFNGNFNGGTGLVTINNSITLGGDSTINSSNLLFLENNINLSNHNLIFDSLVAGTIQVDGIVGGNGNISTTGDGTTSLASNSFVGNINANSGTLLLTNGTALGNSSNILNVNGGNINIAGAAFDIANAMFFSNGTTLFSSSGMASISGDIDVTGTLTVDVAGFPLTLSGVISGGEIVKANAGRLILSGSSSNTFSGGLTMNEGEVDLDKPDNFDAVNGPVTVGDGSNFALLKLNANDQIPNSLTVDIAANAVWSLNGFSEAVDSITGLGDILVDSPSVLSFGGTSTSFIYDGFFEGDGTIQKTGNANITLNGDSPSYTGQMSIFDGILIVNGNMSAVNIVLTGTLSGSGIVGGVAGMIGTITPGTPRILTASTIDWGAGITYFAKINGTTQGVNYDYIHMYGTTVLNDPILFFFLGYAPTLGDSYTILHADGGLTGNFAGLPDWALFTAGGTLFQINYTANDAIVTASAGYTLLNPSFISSPNPTAGTTITITSTWTGTGPVPTGTAELFDGTTSLGSVSLVGGVATFNIAGLSAGAHSLTVEYSGSAGYGPAISDPLDLNVAAALANTGINLPVQLMALGLLLSLSGVIIVKKKF